MILFCSSIIYGWFSGVKFLNNNLTAGRLLNLKAVTNGKNINGSVN